MSLIAWLDSSAEEQRRVREIVAMFTDKGTQDELGIGQIRDALSDSLFPGTSTIQTRAKYFLFVPWLFQKASETVSGKSVVARVDRYERQLIEALRAAGAVDGLIGVQAGVKVKILPSTIYWSGLTRLGILTRPIPPNQVGLAGTANPDGEELTERVVGYWSPTLPPRPVGLPAVAESGFELSLDEATWLRERILTAFADTQLAHLVSRRDPPDPDSFSAYDDSSRRDTSPDNRRLILDSHLFSVAIEGAAYLYNLLVAERYEAAGLTREVGRVEYYRDMLAGWADLLNEDAELFRAWDRSNLWSVAFRMSPRISLSTQQFVNAWVDAITDGRAQHAATDESLRQLIRWREQLKKGSQSRLINEKMLANWQGASGDNPLVYRWPVVRRIVTDIHQGLSRVGS